MRSTRSRRRKRGTALGFDYKLALRIVRPSEAARLDGRLLLPTGQLPDSASEKTNNIADAGNTQHRIQNHDHDF